MSANQKMLLSMLEMQNNLNASIDVDWKEKNRAWDAAIWVECAEAMDHLAYKWWKKQDVDMEQFRMELVDIWHFILSWGINRDFNIPLNIIFDYPDESAKLPVIVQCIARNASSYDLPFTLHYFMRALFLSGMSFADLYVKYAGKFTLNAFRQDNGYRDGTYRKIWIDGREDNEHLTAILFAMGNAGMDSTDENFLPDIYQALSDRYDNVEQAV